jgi:hypothetical protein
LDNAVFKSVFHNLLRLKKNPADSVMAYVGTASETNLDPYSPEAKSICSTLRSRLGLRDVIYVELANE